MTLAIYWAIVGAFPPASFPKEVLCRRPGWLQLSLPCSTRGHQSLAHMEQNAQSIPYSPVFRDTSAPRSGHRRPLLFQGWACVREQELLGQGLHPPCILLCQTVLVRFASLNVPRWQHAHIWFYWGGSEKRQGKWIANSAFCSVSACKIPSVRRSRWPDPPWALSHQLSELRGPEVVSTEITSPPTVNAYILVCAAGAIPLSTWTTPCCCITTGTRRGPSASTRRWRRRSLHWRKTALSILTLRYVLRSCQQELNSRIKAGNKQGGSLTFESNY